MTDFLIANMAPIIFASMVVFLLVGFPVAFALAANGIVFGLIGIELGLLGPQLFQALPDRIFGIIFFLLPMAIAIMYMSWPIFLLALHSNEQSSNAGGLTVWPVRLLVPIGFFLLVLQAISELIKRVGFLQGLCPDPTAKSHKPTAEEELVLAIKAQKGDL